MLDPKKVLISLGRLTARRPAYACWIDEQLAEDVKSFAVLAVQVAIEGSDAVGQALGRVLTDVSDSVLCRHLHWLIPVETASLNRAAEVVERQVLKAIDDFFDSESDHLSGDEPSVRLRFAAQIGPSRLGESAFAPLREWARNRYPAGRLLLAITLPERYATLQTLAIRLRALGRHAEALAVVDEALDTGRKLYEIAPQSFAPDLAECLNTKAVILAQLDAYNDAVLLGQEAVNICEQLAELQPDEFLPKLARYLTNLGNPLKQLGREEEAFENAERAVRILRQISEAKPGLLVEDLAGALTNLAGTLNSLGRHEQARQCAEESVQLWHAMLQFKPDIALLGYSLSLQSLARTLRRCSHYQAAFEYALEALYITRQLAEIDPEAFTAELATVHELIAGVTPVDRREEAIESAQFACTLFRELASVQPKSYQLQHVDALLTLADLCSYSHRLDESLAAAQEAARLTETMARSNPEAFLPSLVQSLLKVGEFLGNLERYDESVQMYESALKIYEESSRTGVDHLVFAISNARCDLLFNKRLSTLLKMKIEAEAIAGGTITPPARQTEPQVLD